MQALLADARKPGSGTVKFYFAAPDGSLPWLELAPREAQDRPPTRGPAGS